MSAQKPAPNVILVKSYREVKINSTTGHCFTIPANVEFPVPAVVAEEAYARGCFPVNAPQPEPAKAPAAPDAPEGITGLDDSDDVPAVTTEPAPEMTLIEAFHALIKHNDKSDFKNDGTPRVAAVRRVLNKDVSAAEIDAAWVLFQLGK